MQPSARLPGRPKSASVLRWGGSGQAVPLPREAVLFSPSPERLCGPAFRLCPSASHLTYSPVMWHYLLLSNYAHSETLPCLAVLSCSLCPGPESPLFPVDRPMTSSLVQMFLLRRGTSPVLSWSSGALCWYSSLFLGIITQYCQHAAERLSHKPCKGVSIVVSVSEVWPLSPFADWARRVTDSPFVTCHWVHGPAEKWILNPFWFLFSSLFPFLSSLFQVLDHSTILIQMSFLLKSKRHTVF